MGGGGQEEGKAAATNKDASAQLTGHKVYEPEPGEPDLSQAASLNLQSLDENQRAEGVNHLAEP